LRALGFAGLQFPREYSTRIAGMAESPVKNFSGLKQRAFRHTPRRLGRSFT
jgi:hypothetical protein